MDLARRPAPLDGDGLALSKQKVTRTRSRPHPSPSPDRVRGGRPPPRPAAPFSNPRFIGISSTCAAAHSAVSGRTNREDNVLKRGKSVEYVPGSALKPGSIFREPYGATHRNGRWRVFPRRP